MIFADFALQNSIDRREPKNRLPVAEKPTAAERSGTRDAAAGVDAAALRVAFRSARGDYFSELQNLA
jgi:hypothetical protein